jgi:hypothetical protein
MKKGKVIKTALGFDLLIKVINLSRINPIKHNKKLN